MECCFASSEKSAPLVQFDDQRLRLIFLLDQDVSCLVFATARCLFLVDLLQFFVANRICLQFVLNGCRCNNSAALLIDLQLDFGVFIQALCFTTLACQLQVDDFLQDSPAVLGQQDCRGGGRCSCCS